MAKKNKKRSSSEAADGGDGGEEEGADSSSAGGGDIGISGGVQQQQAVENHDVFDTDGTLNVARSSSSIGGGSGGGVGGTAAGRSKQSHYNYERIAQKSQTKETQKHLWGNQQHAAQSRLDALKQDDINPNLDGLSQKQKLALNSRRRRRQSSAGGGGAHSNKIVKAKIQRLQTKRLQAAVAAADASQLFDDQVGLIETENDMERTTAVSQTQLKRHFGQAQDTDNSQKNIYNLELVNTAPYGLEYDRSGRYSCLYGKSSQGHLAVMDCTHRSLLRELYVRERIHSTTFLHNYTMVAVAQQQYAYIYDTQSGAEIHRLDNFVRPYALEFLPYHWLLGGIGQQGMLKYQDTSTGQLVSHHKTKLGPCRVLKQNPTNAVLHAGHMNGCVTLWSPANSKYLVKLQCHKGTAVHSLAIDPATGYTMVTGGGDSQLKVWDLRMYKEMHSYYVRPGIPMSLDISQRGILGIGHAGHATFWSSEALRSKIQNPYMHQLFPKCDPIETLRFRPYEDVCGIGHKRGISSLVIPGSGEPNLDTSEYNTNPNMDNQQRRETEVRALLDKLSPEMIALDSHQIGSIEESDPHKRLERVQDLQEAANEAAMGAKKPKQSKKKRGRSKIQTQLRRKKQNILDHSVLKLREAREKEKEEASAAANAAKGDNNKELLESEAPKDIAPSALKRFF